jgi:glutamate--cysteine ligase
MSGPAKPGGEPISSKRQLVEYIEAGCKSRDDWRIGTEHEKFAFTTNDLRSIPYEGPRGVRALLEGLMRFGWEGIYEGENIIALSHAKGGAVSLEPGGQVELSGAPLRSIVETCAEVHEHLREVKEVAEPLGIGMLGLGCNPKWSREETPWMPKGRYKVMREYMPKVGSMGLDMMLRTCTVQVNLDFSSESDMVKKFRVSLALQPIATALFANSPFLDGKPNGFLSYRSQIWTDTDNNRSGMLPFVFEPGMSFERYVDYALDVPMYFVYREGKYIDAAGLSFRDFMAGKLPVLPGELPSLGDWTDHLTTLFPEVRLKRFLEMRGADGGPWNRLCALPAFWVGLLYDDDALDAAWEMVKDWTNEEREMLRRETPKTALKTKFRQGTVQDLALRALAISSHGLIRRGLLESGFLEPLECIARSGKSPAEEMLEFYHGKWGGSVDPAFTEFAY